MEIAEADIKEISDNGNKILITNLCDVIIILMLHSNMIQNCYEAEITLADANVFRGQTINLGLIFIYYYSMYACTTITSR